jgi:hypothetical protein
LVDEFIKHGKRYCCADNFIYAKDALQEYAGHFKLWVPLIARMNQERYVNFFPKKDLLPE